MKGNNNGKINTNTRKINKPKMARFFKFKFVIALKLNFNWGQFYEIWLFHGLEKSHMKIVKFEVENFEHLHCKV